MRIHKELDTDRIIDALFDYLHSLNTHEARATEGESESAKEEEEEEEEEKSLEEEEEEEEEGSNVSEDNGDLEKTKEEPVKEVEQPQVFFVVPLNLRKHRESTLRSSSFLSITFRKSRKRPRRMMRTEAYIKESMRIFSLLASPQTTPLQKAELNFRFLSSTPLLCPSSSEQNPLPLRPSQKHPRGKSPHRVPR